MDQVAILDYRHSSFHQSSNLTQDLHPWWHFYETTCAWETCQAIPLAPSSIFISFLNIVARSLIFFVNVVSAGGIPLGTTRIWHLQQNIMDIPSCGKLFASVFPGLIGLVLRLDPLHLQTLISSLIHTHSYTHIHIKSLEIHSQTQTFTSQA